jgi:hypothetical protein
MPEDYSPKHFLQQVPYKLPRKLSASRAALLALEWHELDPTLINQIHYARHRLPGAHRTDVESVWALGGGRSSQSVLPHEIPVKPGASGPRAQLLAFNRVARVT